MDNKQSSDANHHQTHDDSVDEQASGFVKHDATHQSRMDHPEMNQMGDMDEGAGDDDSIHPMVRKIMMGRMQGYSEGGKVANKDMGLSTDSGDEMADLKGNEMDDLALRDDLSADDTGASAGDMDGDAQEDMDRKDMVARIMRSRAKKDKLPSPM
jgi:hypothetical protein